MALVNFNDCFKCDGRVIWITGLSGSGKTTIALELIKLLKDSLNVVFLDGDIVRKVIGEDDLGFNPSDRLKNAYRICRLAGMLEAQGLTVVVSTMSLSHEIHCWNRNYFKDYFEIYLKVNIDILKSRDPKGIYSRAKKGTEKNIVGIDLPIEEPKYPDMIIDNSGSKETIAQITKEIFKQIL